MSIKCKKIKEIELRYNSWLSFESTARVEANSGIIHFKTNFGEYNRDVLVHGSESVFLRDKFLVEKFCEYAKIVLDWQPHYEQANLMDGSNWNLTVRMDDDTIVKSDGNNGQPDEFMSFVRKFEELIQKDIAYKGDSALENGVAINVDGTMFTFTVNDSGYDDSSYWLTDASMTLNNSCFNYDTGSTFLEFAELTNLCDELSSLLEDKIESDKHIEFTEPDLEVILHPKLDLRTTKKYSYIREGYEIRDVLAEFHFFPLLDGYYSDQFYSLTLDRQEIQMFLSYANAQISKMNRRNKRKRY